MLDLRLEEADVIVGIDANACRAEEDSADLVGKRRAQRDATSRTRARVDMVRLLNLKVANSFDETPELRHEGTLVHQRRMLWSDWILSSLHLEKAKVFLPLHCRSDHRPVVMRCPEVLPDKFTFAARRAR